MIVDGIVHVFLLVIEGIVNLFPSIPAISADVTGATTWLLNLISSGVYYVQQIVSVPLYDAILGIIVAIWGFEYIYHPIMWALKKIPILNIK